MAFIIRKEENIAYNQMLLVEYVNQFTDKQVKRQIKAPLGATGERIAVGKPFADPIGSAGLMT